MNKLSLKAKVRTLGHCSKHIKHLPSLYIFAASIFNLATSSLFLTTQVRITDILCDQPLWRCMSTRLNKRKDKQHSKRNEKRDRERKPTCTVNTGCIANVLMSLLLISATGNRWLPQMLVINKRADRQPVGPVLNNCFSVTCCNHSCDHLYFVRVTVEIRTCCRWGPEGMWNCE